VFIWLNGQLVIGPASIVSVAALIRYASRGNRGLPWLGLGAFIANVAISLILLAYLSKF
jgi:hypothetical protein